MGRVVEIETHPTLFDEKMKKPQKYARSKKWKKFQKFFEADKKALTERFDFIGNTAIQVAARSDDPKLLNKLLEMLSASERWHALRSKNDHQNRLLHEVAYYCSNVEVANVVFKFETEPPPPEKIGDESEDSKRPLLELTNDFGETPVFRAAKHGRLRMLKLMASRTDLEMHIHRGYDKSSILQVAVLGQYFGAAIWLLGKQNGLADLVDDRGLTCFQILSKMPYVFRSRSRLGTVKDFIYYLLPDEGYHYDEDDDKTKIIGGSRRIDLESGENQSKKPISAISRINYAIWKFLAREWDEIDHVWGIKREHKLAEQLADLLVKKDVSWMKSFPPKRRTLVLLPDSGPSDQASSSSSHKNLIHTPLLSAASTGITEIVERIVDMAPEALFHVSEDGLNILHVVIRHRQLKIYRMLRKYGALEQLAHLISNNGRTPLHQAATMECYKDGGNHSGDAFELQDELHWFHRVKKIIPPYFLMHCADDNLTARELFDKDHSQMLKEAQNWIKETAQSCSAVSVLVATVVFAAAYTVPGGTETSGYPVFLQSPLFLFFTVMDIVALASSLASVVMFLSILTSPFEMDEFYKSLPRKLTLGFTLLFFSLTTTMLAFSATILLTVKLQKKWTSTLIYSASFFPVAVFGLMQFPLYMAVQGRLKQIFKKLKKLLPKRLIRSKRRIKRLFR